MAAWCRELLEQAWAHRWHALALPPAAVVVTALHELAHAIAVLVQGGEVLQWSIMPGAHNWGYVRYAFPDGQPHHHALVALAPYLMWGGVMVLTTLAAVLPVRWGFAAGSTWFVWGYVAPWLDIVNAWVPWLRGRDNDLAMAFGPAGAMAAALLAVTTLLVVLVGYRIHRRLYRERAVSLRLYALLVASAVLGAGAVLWP